VVRYSSAALVAAALLLVGCMQPGTSQTVGGPTSSAAAPIETSAAEDVSRHEGYYYPTVTSSEIYHARAKVLEDSDRARRLAFVAGLTQDQMTAPYAPTYFMFAKGDKAEKLIVVATGDGSLNTLYRMRGLFASLTALARLSPVFQDFGVDDLFTFFDLVRLLGFERIDVSDGRSFTHRITLQ
jgi:hypothetical protein